jgi:hypothetical protein
MAFDVGTAPTVVGVSISLTEPETATEQLTGGSGFLLEYANLLLLEVLPAWPTWEIAASGAITVSFDDGTELVYEDDAYAPPTGKLAMTKLTDLLTSWSASRTRSLEAKIRDAAQLANAIFAHIAANGEVSVTVSSGGLQRTPNPNNADTATQAPAAPVSLSGTIT